MTLQVKYNKLENDCFNPLTVDPNPPHDLNHFSLFLRLENTLIREMFTKHSFRHSLSPLLGRNLIGKEPLCHKQAQLNIWLMARPGFIYYFWLRPKVVSL